MGFINAVWLIMLGAFCIPAMVAKTDKIAPYQGYFGFAAFLWGIWIVVQCILNLDWLSFATGILVWITYLVNALLSIGAGAILGWSLIQKHLLAKVSDNVKAKAEESLNKLITIQPKIGIACIVFGVWVIIATLLI